MLQQGTCTPWGLCRRFCLTGSPEPACLLASLPSCLPPLFSFLQVRQVLGGDRESGALMVGDVVRVGQRLRFMVRDR